MIQDKIQAKFNLEKTVDAQPLVLVNRSEVESALLKKLDEQNFKALVAKITDEMQAVNGNLDAIGTLRKKQEDLEEAIASVTDDINSDDTKELFDEIAREEAIVPADDLNATLCGNATNSSGFNCTGANETVTDDAPPAEALAAVPAQTAAARKLAARRARPAHGGAEAQARQVELFEDVARVLQDEEHRVPRPPLPPLSLPHPHPPYRCARYVQAAAPPPGGHESPPLARGRARITRSLPLSPPGSLSPLTRFRKAPRVSSGQHLPLLPFLPSSVASLLHLT